MSDERGPVAEVEMPGEASNTLVLAAVVLVAALVGGGLLAAHRRGRQAREALLERLGFRPCPGEKRALTEILTRVTRDSQHHYEVEEPRRLRGDPPVYYYVKLRHGGASEARDAGEEILFRLRRRSKSGVVLVVKPSSLAPGVATRLLSAVVTSPWATLPDDLHRIELPQDLKDTNLLGALGPPGASLYDLVDAKLLSVVQGLGDAGGMTVQFRDDWCAIAAGHFRVPFRVDELLARLRPLL